MAWNTEGMQCKRFKIQHDVSSWTSFSTSADLWIFNLQVQPDAVWRAACHRGGVGSGPNCCVPLFLPPCASLLFLEQPLGA